MEDGSIVFAGKYSEPDYELLVNSGCNLAIESTMILHTPKVQEMIEQMGIPVFTDRSSYENHPLGRTEWIKSLGRRWLIRGMKQRHFLMNRQKLFQI